MHIFCYACRVYFEPSDEINKVEEDGNYYYYHRDCLPECANIRRSGIASIFIAELTDNNLKRYYILECEICHRLFKSVRSTKDYCSKKCEAVRNNEYKRRKRAEARQSMQVSVMF